MDERELGQYVDRYYRAPNPSLAPQALQWFASSKYAHDPNARGPAQYFFSRLLELHPELRDAISRARSEVPRGQPPIIDEVLAATEPPNKIVNAIDRHVLSPQNNDLLWAEFSLTGNPLAVERLIDLLDLPDVVRGRIERWLQSRPLMRSIARPIRNRTCTRLRSELGIDCDPASQLVKTPEDLDCQCALSGLEYDKSRFQRALMMLPFRLTEGDLQRMLSKALSKWSLASKACQDTEVRRICEEQIDRRAGSSRLSLLEMVAAAYAAQRENAPASRLAARYLSLDPNHAGMRSLLATVTSRLELDTLMHLTIPDTRGSLADPAGTAKHCIDATKTAWSYRTRRVARRPSDSGQEARMEWNMEYCGPGRFHVTQEAQPGGEFDEWIAIGDDVWRVPFWFHRSGTDLPTGEHQFDAMLSAEPHLKLLSELKPSGGFTADVERRRFAILEYLVEAQKEQIPNQATEETKSYRVWIDQESGLLRRVDIQAHTAQSMHDQPNDCHVFASYNEQISIEPPSSSAESVNPRRRDANPNL